MTIQGTAHHEPSGTVRLDDYWERRYWCRLFGCTERRLRLAVKEVGPSPGAVKERLTRPRRRAAGA